MVHEKFEYDANDEYDVGLLFLTKPVAGVAPVRLAAADLVSAARAAGRVAGAPAPVGFLCPPCLQARCC